MRHWCMPDSVWMQVLQRQSRCIRRVPQVLAFLSTHASAVKELALVDDTNMLLAVRAPPERCRATAFACQHQCCLTRSP